MHKNREHKYYGGDGRAGLVKVSESSLEPLGQVLNQVCAEFSTASAKSISARLFPSRSGKCKQCPGQRIRVSGRHHSLEKSPDRNSYPVREHCIMDLC